MLTHVMTVCGFWYLVVLFTLLITGGRPHDAWWFVVAVPSAVALQILLGGITAQWRTERGWGAVFEERSRVPVSSSDPARFAVAMADLLERQGVPAQVLHKVGDADDGHEGLLLFADATAGARAPWQRATVLVSSP